MLGCTSEPLQPQVVGAQLSLGLEHLFTVGLFLGGSGPASQLLYLSPERQGNLFAKEKTVLVT